MDGVLHGINKELRRPGFPVAVYFRIANDAIEQTQQGLFAGVSMALTSQLQYAITRREWMEPLHHNPRQNSAAFLHAPLSVSYTHLTLPTILLV